MLVQPFINQPLLNLQQLYIYKCWLVHFPIDIDCHKVIKQFLYKLGMMREFTYPLASDIYNSMFLTHIANKNHIVYINNQGIVFKRQEPSPEDLVIKPNIGSYVQTFLYTKGNITLKSY